MSELAFSSAAERNSAPILEVLKNELPSVGRVLEIASGTGQHVAFFAGELPSLQWLPSEPNGDMHAAIVSRTAALANVAAPIHLDVMQDWPDIEVDAVIVANLLHISPAATLQALCAGAGRVCTTTGALHIYGPFKQHGEHTASSNAAFDFSLRARNPLWGIRELEGVIDTAARNGFVLHRQQAMPANNFSLLFRREPTDQ